MLQKSPTTQQPANFSEALGDLFLDGISAEDRIRIDEHYLTVILPRRKRVGELLRVTQSSHPYWKWNPAKGQTEEQHWTGLAGMQPGLCPLEMEAELTKRGIAFSTAAAM